MRRIDVCAFALVLLLSVPLSGCLNDSSNGESLGDGAIAEPTGSDASDGGGGDNEGLGPPGADWSTAALNRTVVMTGCEGIFAYGHVPAERLAGAVPDSFTTVGPTSATGRVNYEAYVCDRIVSGLDVHRGGSIIISSAAVEPVNASWDDALTNWFVLDVYASSAAIPELLGPTPMTVAWENTTGADVWQVTAATSTHDVIGPGTGDRGSPAGGTTGYWYALADDRFLRVDSEETLAYDQLFAGAGTVRVDGTDTTAQVFGEAFSGVAVQSAIDFHWRVDASNTYGDR